MKELFHWKQTNVLGWFSKKDCFKNKCARKQSITVWGLSHVNVGFYTWITFQVSLKFISL